MAMIAEIIGLAGTGKSTLAHMLCQKSDRAVPAEHLSTRNIRHLPYIVWHTTASLPTLLRQPTKTRGFTPREVLKIAYLNGWHRILQQRHKRESHLVILDQGPIYDLATLYGFGPDKLHDQAYRRWWLRMYERWSGAIDLIIWLEAPVDVSINRIRTRRKWHPVKDSAEHVMRDYLLRYQAAHQHTLAEMAAQRELAVLRFNTYVQSAEEIVSCIANYLSWENNSPMLHHAQPLFQGKRP